MMEQSNLVQFSRNQKKFPGYSIIMILLHKKPIFK